MRITLDLDDSVVEEITEIALREGRSAGSVATELMRRALAEPTAIEGRVVPVRHGFRPFPASNAQDLISSEEVDRLRERLGI